MVQEITSKGEYDQAIGTKGKLVVVDFSATWCGPCKRVEPAYNALSDKHKDVAFFKMLETHCQEIMTNIGIRAFPTFRFYLDGQQVDEVQGADIAQVEAKVVAHKAKVQPAFSGAGNSLGGGAAASEMDARAARLARFGASAGGNRSTPPPNPEQAARNAKLLALDHAAEMSVKPIAPPTAPAAPVAAAKAVAEDTKPTPMEVDDGAGSGSGGGGASSSDAAAAAASGDGGAASSTTAPAMTPKRAVDPSVVTQLEEMGFATVRAQKALMYGDGGDLESAINWLMVHQEDADIDNPIPEGVVEGAGAAAEAAAAAQAQSLKCEDCGALLKDVTAAELHAHKTGHSNFSESVEAVKPLTPEEKAKKVQELKEKLAARRVAREDSEKVDHVEREKQRREMGKQMAVTREEMEKQERKRVIDAQKREKKAFEKERERLRAEIAKDQAERKARGGKLASKLSVEGYAPVGLQASGADDGDASDGAAAAPAGKAAAPAAAAKAAAAAPVASAAAGDAAAPSKELVDKAVALLSKQRVGGEGGTAMKTLSAYLKNALAKPDEAKFRTIKLDNKAFKTRVANCVGGVALLKAVGFAKQTDEEGNPQMVMEPNNYSDMLQYGLDELQAALAKYEATGPLNI